MIDKLREPATSLYPSKPALVIKHALPTAFRLLEDNRADLRTGTVQLLRMLHVLLGPTLFDHAQRAPSAVQSRLAEVIHTPAASAVRPTRRLSRVKKNIAYQK